MPAKGSLSVICGPMFSGKSRELIRVVHIAEIAGQRTAMFKARIDTRYATPTSHHMMGFASRHRPSIQHEKFCRSSVSSRRCLKLSLSTRGSSSTAASQPSASGWWTEEEESWWRGLTGISGESHSASCRSSWHVPTKSSSSEQFACDAKTRASRPSCPRGSSTAVPRHMTAPRSWLEGQTSTRHGASTAMRCPGSRTSAA